ncbi:endonuclease/exonuclease/phosphatase family protein [Streptomyces sp. NPDC050485]|uniref:endonuclease/exonuclease/phosphatase family protein n=1 Tax=Streptomyces sp. NPDC050485 TaxID=3365617 RepID=UPI0037ADEAB1
MTSSPSRRWVSLAMTALLSAASVQTAVPASAGPAVGGCFAVTQAPRAPTVPPPNEGGPSKRVLTSFTVETWNMQGSSASGECIWTGRVYPIARDSHVLALQEAGTPPRTARATGITWTQHGLTVNEYSWRPGGSRGGEFFLYWMRTDTSPTGAGRVNLAMVVPAAQRAREVVVAWDANPARQSVRPALGILPTDIDTYVFTVHASAQARTGAGRAGWDAPRIVNAIECALAAAGTRRTWIAAGDWNREPDNWASQAGGTTTQLAPEDNTRPASGAVIDYAVVDRLLTLPRRARTELNRGGGQSDHLPVFLHFGS